MDAMQQQHARGREQRRAEAEEEAESRQQEAEQQQDVASVDGELTGIAVKWARLLEANRLLRQENARLQVRLTAAEAEAERLRAEAGSNRRQYGQSAEPAADRDRKRQRQQRQSEQAVATAAPGRAQAGQKEGEEGKRDGSSASSLPSSDVLFSILFDARRQVQVEEKAPAPVAAQAEAASAAEERKAEPEQRRRPELFSMSTDRMVMELDDLVPAQAGQQQQSDAQRSEASRSDAAVEQMARAAEMGADADPFATQEMAGGTVGADRSALPSREWPTQDELRRRLHEAREQRQRGSEVYRQQQEVQEALSIYQAADRLLSCSVPPSSSLFSAFQSEQAVLLASRAVLLVKLSRWSDAAADVDRLLLLRPQWWKSFSLRARVLSGEQRLEEALAAYEQALHCDMTEAEWRNTRDKMDKLEKRIRLRRGTEAQRRLAVREDGEEQLTAQVVAPFPAMPAVSAPSAAVAMPRPPSPPPAFAASAFPAPEARTIPLSPPRDEPEQQRLPLSPPSSPPLPSSAPLRSSQDYSVLPRITLEGVRDLLGVELFHWAEESVDNVYQLKLKREEDDDGKGGVVVRARCWKEQRWRKRRRGEDGGDQQAADERRQLLELSIHFDGNRVSRWSCSCYAAVEDVMTQQPQQPQQDTQDDDDDAPAVSTPPAAADAAAPSPYGNIDHSLIPCRHIGATLLLIRRKQSTHAAAASASSPTLFVHPTRVLPPAAVAALPALYTQYGQMKGEALRQLLSLNGQSGSGVKDELIERCVEGRLRGVLRKCDRCGGSLFYAAGRVHCKGRFDVNTRQRTVCGRHWPDDAVQRRQWRER